MIITNFYTILSKHTLKKWNQKKIKKKGELDVLTFK